MESLVQTLKPTTRAKDVTRMNLLSGKLISWYSRSRGSSRSWNLWYKLGAQSSEATATDLRTNWILRLGLHRDLIGRRSCQVCQGHYHDARQPLMKKRKKSTVPFCSEKKRVSLVFTHKDSFYAHLRYCVC